MTPDHSMAWIAGWIPLLTFVVSFVLYYFVQRAWLCTLVTLVAALGAMWLFFTFHFWTWLTLYLILCWFACYLAHLAKYKKIFPNSR